MQCACRCIKSSSSCNAARQVWNENTCGCDCKPAYQEQNLNCTGVSKVRSFYELIYLKQGNPWNCPTNEALPRRRRSSYIVLAIVYRWQTKDKRPQRSNANSMNPYQNRQYCGMYIFSRWSIWVLLELVCRWIQDFTKIDQEKRKIEQIRIWKPMTSGSIM